MDECLPLPAIAPALVRLAHTPVDLAAQRPPSRDLARAVSVAEFTAEHSPDVEPSGTPSTFACPDCHGVLYEIQDGAQTRYRCRVGHAYSPASLQESQEEAVEEALWTALRALEGKASLARRLQERAEARGRMVAAAQFAESAAEADQRAGLLRQLLSARKVIPISAEDRAEVEAASS